MSEINLVPNKSDIKSTRFLDDEYPSLGCNGLPDRKKESNRRYKKPGISSGAEDNDIYVNSSNLSKEAKLQNIKDIDSASEWETDNEDQNSRSSFNEEKEIVNLNVHLSQQLDNLIIKELSQHELSCESCPQPKSILRRISTEITTSKEQTGKVDHQDYGYGGKIFHNRKIT